jgi:hypothetical protein
MSLTLSSKSGHCSATVSVKQAKADSLWVRVCFKKQVARWIAIPEQTILLVKGMFLS